MLNEIFLAAIQAITEFFPVSSSGHLALFSNLAGEPDLSLITFLHLASLLAVLIFTRKEIFNLLSFKKEYRKLWLFLIIASIPAVLIGFFFKSAIEKSFSSFLVLGIAWIFSGIIIFFTKFSKVYSNLNYKNSFLIGLFQVLALFPGVSRSGMTISSALFSGINKEKAVKFSFLLFIPLSLGAFLLEAEKIYFSYTLLVSFIICFILSLVFINFLCLLIRKNKFWVFSVYNVLMGVLALYLYFKI